MTTPAIGFQDAVKQAHDALAAEGGSPGPSVAFKAFLGLSLLDPGLVSFMRNPQDDVDNRVNAAITEFGLTAPEATLVKQVVAGAAFEKAQSSLLSNVRNLDANPWLENCPGEQYVYWDPQNDRAIL